MDTRRTVDAEGNCEEGPISGFLRSLLSGIPLSESATRDESREIDLRPSTVIDVRNARGRTRVIGEDRQNVAIAARKHARAENKHAAKALLDAIDIESNEMNGTLAIGVVIPRRWNRHGSVDLEIRVPRDVRMRVHSSNGKLCLRGLRCGVQARSSNGSIRIDDVVGNIDIATANAKVICACTTGRLTARSSNGKIEVGEHSGSIDACTSNGLIRVGLQKLDASGVTLATSNGRIVLDLPEKANAEVDIRVDNGVIHNELALGLHSDQSTGRLRGRLGRGGTPIKLRTSNGTISLR